MDKYRKIYNDNYKANTVVSIFKSHFACFKMQQLNGKAVDINQFLDSSVQSSIRMKRKLKRSGIFPFVNQIFGTGKEDELLIEVIKNKRNDVVNLFLQEDISDEEIIRLVYNITDKTKADTTLNTEDKLKLAKDYILQCYSIDGDRHLGDRTFGYLIKANLIKANTLKERLAAWHNLITADIKPSNVKLFRTPNLSRSKSKVLIDKTLIENLEKIQSFFNEIGLNDVANIVGKDIEKEWSKTK